MTQLQSMLRYGAFRLFLDGQLSREQLHNYVISGQWRWLTTCRDCRSHVFFLLKPVQYISVVSWMYRNRTVVNNCERKLDKFLLRPGRWVKKYCEQRLCVSICLSARTTQKPQIQISLKFLYMLPVTVTQSLSDTNVIRHILQLCGWNHFWSKWARIKDDAYICFDEFARWRQQGRSCCLRLQACSIYDLYSDGLNCTYFMAINVPSEDTQVYEMRSGWLVTE